MTYLHVHVSERPDNPVVECTFAAGLEVARAGLNGKPNMPPASSAEREALRTAAGVSDTSGASIADLVIGCQRRYGWVPAMLDALPDLDTLAAGTFLVVQGNYHALPAHYQRWDTAFASQPVAGHAVCVYRLTDLMWCDPLAPWDAAWHGERVASSVVRTYFDALPGARVASARLAVIARYRVVIRQRTPIYAKPDGTRLGFVSKATYITSRSKVSGHWWYRILGPSYSAHIGHWFPAEPWLEVTPL